MEDLRDETLSSIFKGFQACIRYYCTQKNKKKREDQLNAQRILQKNIQSWTHLRTWEWFTLLTKAKALAISAKDAERLQELLDKANNMQVLSLFCLSYCIPGALRR